MIIAVADGDVNAEDCTPKRITLGSRTVDVIEVLDRWLAPDHRYYRIRGDDGHLYIIRHDVPSDRWELTMFDRQS